MTQPQRLVSFADRISVAALAANESPVGAILRSLPRWLLREADRRAEQDHDPKHLPMPDPWATLIHAPCVWPEAKEVFEAAQSSLFGLRRLFHMGQGMATLNTDWHSEAANVTDQCDMSQLHSIMQPLVGKFVMSSTFREEVKAERDPALLAEMEAVYAHRRKQLSRQAKNRRKAETFEPMRKVIQIRQQYPLAFWLVQHWLCFPVDLWPGLMFWSNEAITEWYRVSTGQDLPPNYVKKIRQRLGLKPVSVTTPVIFRITTRRFSNGNGIALQAFNRKGERVFRGEMS